MISPSSLSAFASSVAPAGQATRVAAPANARSSQPDPVQKPLQALPPGATPSRTAPRGSLLDLSV